MNKCATCKHWLRDKVDSLGLADCGRINHLDDVQNAKSRWRKVFLEKLGATAPYSFPDPVRKNQYGFPLQVRNPEWDAQKSLRDEAWKLAEQEARKEIDPAYVYDGSSYVAGLSVTEEFGCVMWEEIATTS